MLGGEINRLHQFLTPVIDRLGGTGIDQIKTRALERALRQLNGRDGLFHTVLAPQSFEIVIIERLHADR